MVSSCCYSAARDMLLAASALTFVAYLSLFLGALHAVWPVWDSERGFAAVVGGRNHEGYEDESR